MLDVRLMFCARHLAPFRADWPAGYPMAMLLLFLAFAARADTASYARGTREGLQAALREFGPVCCLLDAALTRRIVACALAGDMDEFVRIRTGIAVAAGLAPDALDPKPVDG